MAVYVPAAVGFPKQKRPDRFIDNIRQHRPKQNDPVVYPLEI
ncbi:MAG: hypothetical protein Q7R50_05340 [Dehalococcoidales bacterium]|nr:hypothetical protein [Dehalococcoidales bacterium]